MRRLYEWKQMNKTNNSSTTSSTGYKNRFKKLIDYAQTHTAPIVTKTEVVKLDNYFFEYKEYFEATDGTEWVSSITTTISSFDDKWAIKIMTDEMLRAVKTGEGYEDLIRALGFYMNTPNYGTPEYDNLLVESLTETAEDFKTYETMWD